MFCSSFGPLFSTASNNYCTVCRGDKLVIVPSEFFIENFLVSVMKVRAIMVPKNLFES